jgi:hypothetical protein
MDLIKEERKGRSNKRVLSEIDVSEWEITYKEICSREGKQSYNSGKTTQLLEGETRSQAEILGTQKGKKLYIIKKISNKFPSPRNFHPSFSTIVNNLGISKEIARTLSSTNPTAESEPWSS